MNFYNLNCYPHLEYLFTTKEDDEILYNSLEVMIHLIMKKIFLIKILRKLFLKFVTL